MGEIQLYFRKVQQENCQHMPSPWEVRQAHRVQGVQCQTNRKRPNPLMTLQMGTFQKRVRNHFYTC